MPRAPPPTILLVFGILSTEGSVRSALSRRPPQSLARGPMMRPSSALRSPPALTPFAARPDSAAARSSASVTPAAPEALSARKAPAAGVGGGSPFSSGGPRRSVRVGSRAEEKIEEFAKKNFDLPRESVISAVERKGGRVTASDAAAVAGVELTEATKDLNKLASLTGGALEVSRDGDIVYNFDANLRTQLASQSAGIKARELWITIWPVLQYLTKISFGLAIFASITFVYGAIAVISSSSSSSDRDRDRGGGGGGFEYRGGGPNVFVNFGNPFDLFYYRPYGYYYPPASQRVGPGGGGEEMGLLESIFSYVFGDGNPNAKLQEQQLRAAAAIVRDNGGVVTAEQLAPVLSPDKPPSAEGDDPVDESFVLDVIVALNGQPEVTSDGSIVYVFPDLAITAEVANDQGEGYLPMDLTYEGSRIIQEEEIPFSNASDMNKIIAGGLGIINVVGALYLGTLLRDPYLAYKVGPPLAQTMRGLFPWLLTYAAGYNILPLARSWVNKAKNAEIETRNYLRALWAKHAAKPAAQRKIRAAKALRPRGRVIRSSDIEYSSARELDEQPGVAPDAQELRSFDQRLGSGAGEGGRASRRGASGGDPNKKADKAPERIRNRW